MSYLQTRPLGQNTDLEGKVWAEGKMIQDDKKARNRKTESGENGKNL